MSFALPQERARLSYSQTALLPSFQLQQAAVRSTQPPSASPYSYQPADLSHQHPHPHTHPHPHHPHPHSHPHSHPHPHPHPHPRPISDGFLPITDRGKPSPVPRSESISRPRPQENHYLVHIQEASHTAQSKQRTQSQDGSLSLPNGARPESIESQSVPAASGSQDSPQEIAKMTRPPEGVYPTFEALLTGANQHAFSRGYAFVIGRSKKKNKVGLKKVLLSCDKGGTSHHKMLPLDSDKRKRKTTTRKTGCEFGVYAIESQTEWTLKYRPDPACALHNHGPSKSVTEHPAARKLNPNAIAAVKAMKDAGISAQDTLKEIQRENPGTPLIARDVYNARAALRRDPDRATVELAVVPNIVNIVNSAPQIYRRATMTPEERLRDDLRLEVTKAKEESDRVKEDCRKEVEALQSQLKEKDKMIEKFEMFIDICNQRVMVQRERLTSDDGPQGGGGGGSGSGGGPP